MMCEFKLGEKDLSNVLVAIDEKMVHQGGIVLLQGDLGSGKTTLVKAFVAHTGCDEQVTSPTFSIAQEYGSNQDKIYHYDFYRKSLEELLNLGLLEMLERKGIHFIEWGDESLRALLESSGLCVMSIKINASSSAQERIYKVQR